MVVRLRAGLTAGPPDNDPVVKPGGGTRGFFCGGLSVREAGERSGAFGVDKFGFKDLAAIHWNLTEPALYEHAIRAGEARLAYGGPLAADTGVHTGRSPKDKFIVSDQLTEKTVWWGGNNKITQDQFNLLCDDFI